MKNIPKIEWRPYLDLLIRRKWWIIIPVILSLTAGGIYLKTAPKLYRASTLILVESQRVPENFVPSTVRDDLQVRLQTISQQIHSRTNLESIVERFELYTPPEELSPGLLQRARNKVEELAGFSQASAQQLPGTSMQQRVQSIRSRIEISLRANNQVFEIAFNWHDPQVAANVANAIASQFIDQNLRVREDMAMGTTRFLDFEVARLQGDLEKREIALEQFKRRNMGRLPSQLQSNLNILSQLKDELSRTEEHINQVRQQLQFDLDAVDGEPELVSLQKSLRELRNRYTEQHPEVQAVKRRVERLMSEEEPSTAGESTLSDNLQSSKTDLVRARLNDQEKRLAELRRQIQIYEDRVEQTSEVELELKNLERDYAAVNDRFQILLRRKLDAELAEQMERRQQGEQFRVVDRAIAPDRPFKPDVNRGWLLALVFGLGLGGGMAFIREGIDPAFYTSEEVEETLKPDLLISIPLVKKIKNNRNRFSGGNYE